MTLLIKLLSETARAPTKGSPKAAGFDCYVDIPSSIYIGVRERALIPLGFSCAFPPGCYGRIAPRSGLAWKQGLEILAGVIDPDYTGQVTAILLNSGSEAFLVEPGMRVCQFILESFVTDDVLVVDELPTTVRANGGFGSTGLF